MKTRVLLVCVVGLAICAKADKQPMDRYQSIIDRQMFGPLPPDFDPTKMPSEVAGTHASAAAEKELTKEQAQLQSSIQFSVVNVDRDGKTVVGFTDNSDPKAPKHHYLRVGESQDGWTVKEADAEHATMTVVKDGVEVALTLGENSGKGNGKTGPGGRPGADRPNSLLASGASGSLRERRLARRQAQQEAARKNAAEAAEKEAARQAQIAEDKAEREADRAAQRQQLLAIQDELRKVREERQKQQDAEKSETGDKGGGNDNAE